MDNISVSELIKTFFEKKGVRNVFLLSGGMMMNLLDSISKSEQIKYICNHHEQASAMAAEGYARITNGIGLCYATSGPGATNTITGMAGAWLDSSPVFFITGQSRTSLTIRGTHTDDLRMLGNFEVDIVDIVKSITKYAHFVDNENEILYHLEKAYSLAVSGRPGPVLLDIPLDIQGKMVNVAMLKQYSEEVKAKVDLTVVLEKLGSLFKESKKPVIIGGHGIRVANQVDLFRSIIAKYRIPVVTTQLANDLMEYDNELYIGKVGLRGDRAGNHAVQNADLIICIGTSLHITTTGYEIDEFAPNAKKVFIDLDDAVIKKNSAIIDLNIKSEVGYFLSMFDKLVFDNYESWVAILQKWKLKLPVIAEHSVAVDNKINTYIIVDRLSSYLKGNETIVTDAGSLYYIVGQTFRVKKGQRVIVSGALGAMGYALPASIGISAAIPNDTVICITGDGSLQLNIQELQTLVTYDLNCKVLVINNKGYASIRNSQISFLKGHIAGASEETGVKFPSLEKIADAYAIPYASVSDVNFIEEFFDKVFKTRGPFFGEIIIPENVSMTPAVTSVRLPNGSFKSSKLDEMSPLMDMDELVGLGLM